MSQADIKTADLTTEVKPQESFRSAADYSEFEKFQIRREAMASAVKNTGALSPNSQRLIASTLRIG